jgi:dTDP-4-amino-4,6-dideoxygalactose transaminase
MNEPVRLMRPYIHFDEVEADFRAVFASGQFTRGPYVDAFVKDILGYTGSQHAFLATSATTALWISLKCLGISAGDEVAVSDFSFPATANVVEDLGATPIFVDVDLDTFNMSPADLAAKIGPKTKAVIFVDALGNPTGLHEIQELCRKHNLPLIEDAACAIGSTERGVRCGAIADITCFSFHPRKLLNTGEGGAITTNRDEWADWLRVKLMHGASGMRGLGLDFVEFGYNFRLPELQAIMGSKQLAQLDGIVADRNVVREAYVERLEPMGFIPQKIGHDVRHNVQSLVFRVPKNLDRDALVHDLKAHDIEATLGTYCMSGTTYFARKYDDVQPRSHQLERTTITLPCYKDVPVARVCDEIARFVSRQAGTQLDQELYLRGQS